MEEEIVQLLAAAQNTAESPRKQAELQLRSLYPTPGFGIALASVGSHESIPLNIRQAALLFLRQFVQAAWSSEFEEFQGQVLVSDEDKARLRQILLDMALNAEERKLKNAASYVISKIGSVDFPDEWPDLLPAVLNIIRTGNDDQLNGALKALVDLLEESFNEEQFFGAARELVSSVYDIAINETKRPILRALAVSAFRACFDILEMVMEEHKTDVKAFADDTLGVWIPFFIELLKSKLPELPLEEVESQDRTVTETYRGFVALKVQVVKVC
jgi:hypothetical protein